MVLGSSLGQVLSQYFSTQMFKWIPANLMCGDNPAMDQSWPKIFGTLGKMPAGGTLFGMGKSLFHMVNHPLPRAMLEYGVYFAWINIANIVLGSGEGRWTENHMLTKVQSVPRLLTKIVASKSGEVEIFRVTSCYKKYHLYLFLLLGIDQTTLRFIVQYSVDFFLLIDQDRQPCRSC